MLLSSIGVIFIWTAFDIFFSIITVYINEISSNYYRSKVPFFYLINAIAAFVINFLMYYLTSYRTFYMIVLI